MNSSLRATCGAYLVAVTAEMSVFSGLVVETAIRVVVAAVVFLAVTAVVVGITCRGLFRKLHRPLQSA